MIARPLTRGLASGLPRHLLGNSTPNSQNPAHWPALGLWFKLDESPKGNGTILANYARPGGVDRWRCTSAGPGGTATFAAVKMT